MRLIDAHRLLSDLNKEQIEGDELYKGLKKAKRIVIDQPTIDAVPVVRCKDCKFNYANYIPGGDHCFKFYELSICEDFYCACGEKIDVEEVD